MTVQRPRAMRGAKGRLGIFSEQKLGCGSFAGERGDCKQLCRTATLALRDATNHENTCLFQRPRVHSPDPHRTWAEIDLAALRHNVSAVRHASRRAGGDHGRGEGKRLRARRRRAWRGRFAGIVEMFAVANLAEAMELRAAGIDDADLYPRPGAARGARGDRFSRLHPDDFESRGSAGFQPARGREDPVPVPPRDRYGHGADRDLAGGGARGVVREILRSPRAADRRNRLAFSGGR